MQLAQDDDDVDYFTSKDGVCVGWNVIDPESGVRKSKVSVCTELNINDCLLYDMDVGNQTSACLADLEFKDGVRYMTIIRAENYVGLSTELDSDGFLVDSTPPLQGELIVNKNLKPTLEETSEQFTHSIIAVQWNGFWDKESGVQIFYVCVGTKPGDCNSKNFTAVIGSTTYTFHDLLLVQGETYFVSIKAVNRASLTSGIESSDGIVVDKTGTHTSHCRTSYHLSISVVEVVGLV